jgi:hypothetical protein
MLEHDQMTLLRLLEYRESKWSGYSKVNAAITYAAKSHRRGEGKRRKRND